MDDDVYAKMILTAPPPENWKRPPGFPVSRGWTPSSKIESLQPDTEWSSWPASEPPSVEANMTSTYGATYS